MCMQSVVFIDRSISEQHDKMHQHNTCHNYECKLQLICRLSQGSGILPGTNLVPSCHVSFVCIWCKQLLCLIFSTCLLSTSLWAHHKKALSGMQQANQSLKSCKLTGSRRWGSWSFKGRGGGENQGWSREGSETSWGWRGYSKGCRGGTETSSRTAKNCWTSYKTCPGTWRSPHWSRKGWACSPAAKPWDSCSNPERAQGGEYQSMQISSKDLAIGLLVFLNAI